LKTALSFTQQYPWNAKQNPAKNPVGPKLGDRAIIRLVGHRLKSQTDSRTKQLHKNFKLNLKLKPQLRSTNNCLHITELYKLTSQQEVKETSALDNNLRRRQPLALPVAHTCLCQLKTERGQGSFFKHIFMPYVSAYDKSKKEIISMSAGKFVNMTDTNHGHNIIN